MKTLQKLLMKKKPSRTKRKHQNDGKSKKRYCKNNLIEEVKRKGIEGA